MSVAGLIGVICAGVVFTQYTPYPGSAATLPCFATAGLIAAGSAVTDGPSELLLGHAFFQWMGKRSYSLYLWHWPILIIAEERVGRALPVWHNCLLVGLAIGLSEVTYRLFENPIRKAKLLRQRTAASLALGAALVASSIGVAQLQLATHGGTSSSVSNEDSGTG
jgi:peptidoglycan/LPS O-acetylase OafA/YrhL